MENTFDYLHDMEWYFKYGSAQAIPHYNCSLHNESLDFWETQGERDVPLGIAFVTFGCIVEILYILVLHVIVARNMIKLSCYKIIFSLGMYDIAATFIVCIITGYYLIIGAVYCTSPDFQYVVGCFSLSLWCGACLTALLLVVNRIIDLWKPHLMDVLFDGYRTLLWILAPLTYCTYFTMIPIPVFYYSPLKAWFFNPFIPNNDQHEFYNYPHSFNNTGIVATTCTLYAFLCYVFISKFRSGAGASKKQMSIVVQSLVICSANLLAALIYVSFQFFDIPTWFILFGHICWIGGHAMPVFVYLFMNKTIQKEVLLLFTAKKVNVVYNSNTSNNKMSINTKQAATDVVV